jgi:predicted DCC family thiol-disulfide oxidoreductase YuxK
VTTRETDQPVILFDGVCNLCNGAVQFVIEHDPDGQFRFAPLQSAAGREWCRSCGLDPDQHESVVLVADGTCYTKSDAAIEIARRLESPYGLLSLLTVVPRPLRDFGYDLVAASRYRVFGRRDACMVPTDDVRDRFLATPSE